MKLISIVVLYTFCFTISYYVFEYTSVDIIKLKKENKELKSLVKELKEENLALKEEIKELSKTKQEFTLYQSLFFMSIVTIIIILYLIHREKNELDRKTK